MILYTKGEMRMKKFILPIMLALAVMASMTACGQNASQTGPTEPEVTDSNNVGYVTLANGTLTVSTADKNAAEINVPEKLDNKKVTKLSKSAFKMFKAETIVLPETLESISDYAFAFCKNLKSVNIPSKVKKIGQNSFTACESLKTITLPEGLKSIGVFAFNGSGLEKITIPKSVKSIQSFAFAECEGLKEVTITGDSTQLDDKAFTSSDNVTIIAPKDSEAIKYAKENNIKYKTSK